jgi:hypothetical protein
MTDDSKPPAKRGRGRPRKHPPIDGPTRSRGRPRKQPGSGRPPSIAPGQVYGWLTVQADSGQRTTAGAIVWSCVCRCGRTHTASTQSLRRGDVGSCGQCRRINPPKGDAT